MQEAKNRQKFAIWAPSHNFVGLYLINQGTYQQVEKKLLKQQYLFHMSPQYGELRPTSGWDRSGSLEHPSKFQQISRLGSITAATSLNGSQQNFARYLAVSWAGTLHTHFWGSCPLRNITLHPPSLALLYFGSITARHLSSWREPNFAALSTGRHLYSAGQPSRWALAHILVLSVKIYCSIYNRLWCITCDDSSNIKHTC